jgi:hypothetical protein
VRPADTSSGIAARGSAPIASTLLRQRCSGSPSSSRKPPFWPPVPQAQERQALWWVRLCQKRGPLGDRVARARPSISGQPPPGMASSDARESSAPAGSLGSERMVRTAGQNTPQFRAAGQPPGPLPQMHPPPKRLPPERERQGSFAAAAQSPRPMFGSAAVIADNPLQPGLPLLLPG